MMNARLAALLSMAAISVALTGCNPFEAKEPKGQVVATLAGDEITAIDLKNEMGDFTTPDPKVRKAAEARALDQILARRSLAEAADKAGIAKTPEYAQQEKRLKEALLVQLWQTQLAKAVPAAAPEEAERYITEHPDLYGDRKLYLADQIRFQMTSDPRIVQQLGPLKTLEQIEALLTANKVPYQKGTVRIDALALGPDLATRIARLPADEVFAIPTGNLILVNHIRETNVTPFTGPPATQHALQLMKALRTQEAIRRQFGAVVQNAKKDVKYAKAYQPALPPKAVPAAAPAAAAPAATPVPVAGG